MKTRTLRIAPPVRLLLLASLLAAGGAALAQTPVDENGEPLGPVFGEGYTEAADAEAEIELLSAGDLETLVGPVALYPDDLLAIVLPASTYPLEIVQAARFLDELEENPSAEADESWDDSVVALLNYPEALRMMSEDIDWTWRLGEAVVAQQADVVAAVEVFRDRAYAAGNLKSDDRQTVSRTADDVIEIEPVEDDVIYVPYYEPEEVVVYQPRRAYYYYPRAYPVYYYPYPAGHHFVNSYFWGVTTAFRIGWVSDHLHVHHHSFHGHPYFGWNYYGSYWRRPNIHVFNSWYGSWGYRNARDRYRYGSYWRPRHWSGARPGVSVARSRYFSNRRRASSEDGYADRNPGRRHEGRRNDGAAASNRFVRDRRGDDGRTVRRQGDRRDDGRTVRRQGNRRDAGGGARQTDEREFRFRPRDNAAERGIRRNAGERATPRRNAAGTPGRRVADGTLRQSPAAESRPRRLATGASRGESRGAERPAPANRRAMPQRERPRAGAVQRRPASSSRQQRSRQEPVRRALRPSAPARRAAPTRRAAPPATAPARRSSPSRMAPSRPSSRAAPAQRRPAAGNSRPRNGSAGRPERRQRR